jgi:prolipoprotein diacylglyceryl transferase
VPPGVPASLLAYLPSPSSGQLHLGPLRITAYGFMIALGVIAAVELARRRAPSRGADPDDISVIATWAVPAGLVGARAYHVITDWWRFRGHWIDIFKIWEGGLGIPGGMAAGVVVGLWVAHRRGLRLADALDVVAPALPLAQAIGRWGNWWNQELFGRPTTLPWALEIDPAHRPPGYEAIGTYHPTFLYESLWDLGLCLVLVLLDRRHRLRRGQLFCLYVAGYGLGRLWVESLRIDEASHLGPFRVNIWMSLVAIVAGAIAFVIQGRRAPVGGMAPGVAPGVAEPVSDSRAEGASRADGDAAGDAADDDEAPDDDEAGEAGDAAAGDTTADNATADDHRAGDDDGRSAAGELGEDRVVEAGPRLLRPRPERGVRERDAAEAGGGVDPAEGAGPAEVAERPS